MLQKLFIHVIMFGEAKLFNRFTECCQKESVSPLLLALANMILEAPTITDCYEKVTPAALSIAQLLANVQQNQAQQERIYH